jgi:hypothetical protein
MNWGTASFETNQNWVKDIIGHGFNSKTKKQFNDYICFVLLCFFYFWTQAGHSSQTLHYVLRHYSFRHCILPLERLFNFSFYQWQCKDKTRIAVVRWILMWSLEESCKQLFASKISLDSTLNFEWRYGDTNDRASSLACHILKKVWIFKPEITKHTTGSQDLK